MYNRNGNMFKILQGHKWIKLSISYQNKQNQQKEKKLFKC